MTKTVETHNKRWLFWLFIAVLFFVFIYLIRSILLPFVLGIGIAYLLDPITNRMEKNGVSRGLATALITACFFLSFILLSILIIPIIATQLSGLLAALPGYMGDFQEKYTPVISHWLGDFPLASMDSVKSAVADFSGVMVKLAEAFITGLFHSGMGFVHVLSLILITPVVAFYLLRDWRTVTRRFNNLLPRQHADVIHSQIVIIEKTLDGFVRGQLTVCLILGTYYALALSLVGLKFGIVIGLMTGFLVIFPYVGLILGMATGLAVAFFQFDNYEHIGAVLAIFIIGQITEGYFITPRLVGKKVGLHPVWIIFGMLSGAALFGFVGVLIAVPTTAVIGVLIRFALDRYLHSTYYEGEKLAARNPAPKKS